MSFGSWLSNAAKSVGHAAGALANFVHQNTGLISAAATGIAAAAGADIDPSTIAQITKVTGDVAGGIAHPNQAISQLAGLAGPIIQADPTLAAARNMVPPAGLQGFDAAVAAMKNPKTTQAALDKIRAALSGPAKQAFDTAVAAHVGQVTNVIPPGSPDQQAAYAITKGLQGGTDEQKSAIIQAVAANPAAQSGVSTALDQVSNARRGWIDDLYDLVFVWN